MPRRSRPSFDGTIAPQQRHRDVEDSTCAQKRPEVLRQTRSAKREPGREIGRRDVELSILADDPHHLLGVRAEPVAQIGDFVREADLERVIGVADVLDHLRGSHGGLEKRRVDAGIQLAQHGCRRGIVAADQNERRMLEVLERGAFAHELRVHGDSHCRRRELSFFHQDAVEHPCRGSRQHRAAEDDGQRPRPSDTRFADGAGDMRQRREILLSLSEVRRSNADQRDLAGGKGLLGVFGRREAPFPHDSSEHLVETRLDDRRQPRVDHGDLVGTDIDAKDAMTGTRETAGRDASNVAETEYRDCHDEAPLSVRGHAHPRRRGRLMSRASPVRDVAQMGV